MECLSYLKDSGIIMVLDDFGTGHIALNQLINYPVNGIKIDKIFTDLLLTDRAKGETMIRAIFAIAREYKLVITVEGLKKLSQFEYLQAEGCDLIQGYLYSEPLTFSELIKGLRNQDQFLEPINQELLAT